MSAADSQFPHLIYKNMKKNRYNIIALDPSLISTAMIVYNADKDDSDFKIFNYCRGEFGV